MRPSREYVGGIAKKQNPLRPLLGGSKNLAVWFRSDDDLPKDVSESGQHFTGDIEIQQHPAIGTLCGGTGIYNPNSKDITFQADSGAVTFSGRFSDSFDKLIGHISISTKDYEAEGEITLELFTEDDED